MKVRCVMIVDNPRREITQCFAGCTDLEDGKTKAGKIFKVITFKKVEEAK